MNEIEACINELPQNSITDNLKKLMEASPFILNVTSAYIGLMHDQCHKKTSYGFDAKYVESGNIHHSKRQFHVVDALAIMCKNTITHGTAIFPIEKNFGKVSIIMVNERLFCVEHNRYI